MSNHFYRGRPRVLSPLEMEQRFNDRMRREARLRQAREARFRRLLRIGFNPLIRREQQP